jgi:hypothetical protein
MEMTIRNTITEMSHSNLITIINMVSLQANAFALDLNLNFKQENTVNVIQLKSMLVI